MIGIKFIIKNDYDSVLKKIFDKLSFDGCYWYIVEDEILDKNGKDFFSKKKYIDDDFKKIIKRTHYPVFVNLQLWRNDDKVILIKNYSQFLISNCILEFFITDNSFVEIYSKDSKVLEQIYQNANYYNFSEIKYINNVQDTRNEFSAYTD